MTHVSLFTGIGGLDLAAEAAGFETVLQVEREPFALAVLAKHWPDVPRLTDVREVHDDERWSNPTVVSGGFPCQPFSAAGKRRGSEDDRYLWPELLRIVDELRPAWVVGENVSGLLSIDDGMEIDRLLASLEAANYTPWVLHYPAAGVGAVHKRDRVFIVAHRRCEGFYKQRLITDACKKSQQLRRNERDGVQSERQTQDSSMADTNKRERKAQRQDTGGSSERDGEEGQRRGLSSGGWWESEPDVGRVANGVPRRVDRLKALGNAVVPAQAYPIFKAIAEAEK